MTEEDFTALMEKTTKVQDTYNTNTEKKIILTDVETLRQYPYATTKLAGLYPPITFGFTDRFFGGQIQKVAKVKDKPYYLLVNKDSVSIGIYIRNEDLKEFTVPELKKLADRYKKKYSITTKKEELIDQLTQ